MKNKRYSWFNRDRIKVNFYGRPYKAIQDFKDRLILEECQRRG